MINNNINIYYILLNIYYNYQYLLYIINIYNYNNIYYYN